MRVYRIHSVTGLLLFALLAADMWDDHTSTAFVHTASYSDTCQGTCEANDFGTKGEQGSLLSYDPLPDSIYSRRMDALIEIGRAFGDTEEAIRQALGEPVERIARDTTNIHTGDTDTYLILVYEGIAFTLYRVNATGDELLSRTILIDTILNDRLPFAMGAHQVEILDYLGQPFHTAAHGEELFLMQYETISEGATDILDFWMEGDHLVRLEWGFYVD